MASPTLVVMAAGIGSRYGGVKQIDPVGPHGEIIIDYSVYDALRSGFGKVVFIIRKSIEEAFRDKVGRAIEKKIDTAYVFQELDKLPADFSVPAGREKPWGTGHAILMARNEVKAPFAVINADDFYGAGAFQVVGDFLKGVQSTAGIQDFCLAGYVLRNTLSENGSVARGVCAADTAGYLVDIRERTKIMPREGRVMFEENGAWTEVPPESLVSMNMWGFTPALFNELERRFPLFLKEKMEQPKSEFFIPEVVAALIREGKARAKVLKTDEKWFGVTYKEDKPVVEAAVRDLVRRNVYPAKLWN